jgi:2-methylfumaryl-CoA isomerase
MVAGTSPRPLGGVRVIELSSFVAAPTAGLTLAQLGADVIRIDPVGGAADVHRWPLCQSDVGDSGRSLYWAGLNRGKRSAEIDLSTPDGRTLLADLVCAPGPHAGVLVSNLWGKSWLSDEELRARRPDLVHVQVLGRSNGAPAVDYTVNAASGLPYATGPAGGTDPVNHALPAWDLLCGMHAAVAVLAGLHRRVVYGAGTHVTISLEDVAASTLTTLGLLPEALQTGTSRPSYGNELYGTFGADFALADGRRVMVCAITVRQWRQLLERTGTVEAVASAARDLDVDFDDEGQRFTHREVLTGLLRSWFAARTLEHVHSEFDGSQVLWSEFRHLTDAAAALAAGGSPVITARDEDGLGHMLTTTGPLRWRDEEASPPATAPVLGRDTDEVLRLVGDE